MVHEKGKRKLRKEKYRCKVASQKKDLATDSSPSEINDETKEELSLQKKKQTARAYSKQAYAAQSEKKKAYAREYSKQTYCEKGDKKEH